MQHSARSHENSRLIDTAEVSPALVGNSGLLAYTNGRNFSVVSPKARRKSPMNEYEHLQHNLWSCRHYVVFIHKCRCKVLFRGPLEGAASAPSGSDLPKGTVAKKRVSCDLVMSLY
jgi:hypothetical protein